MDLDNIQQNMNTRVVFKEPRGMIKWLQLFFAIMAFSTVFDFYTTIGVDITCPTATTPAPPPSSSSSSPVPPKSSPAPLTVNANNTIHPKLLISYPFDFSQQYVNNTCQGANFAYKHQSSLSGSPQFFVMTGILSVIYAFAALVVYLLYSSTYDSIPVIPVADLIVTAILCLFWFIASTSFSSGVTLLKSTLTYENVVQTLCPPQFQAQPGASCAPSTNDVPSWKSLNVGLVSGFTSFFLWGSGLWFVYKETHFHAPRDQFGTR